jgi:hypothetical protein
LGRGGWGAGGGGRGRQGTLRGKMCLANGARRFGVYLGVSVGIECVFVVVLSVFPKSSSVSLPWNIRAQGARNKLGLLSLSLSSLSLSPRSLSISRVLTLWHRRQHLPTRAPHPRSAPRLVGDGQHSSHALATLEIALATLEVALDRSLEIRLESDVSEVLFCLPELVTNFRTKGSENTLRSQITQSD